MYTIVHRKTGQAFINPWTGWTYRLNTEDEAKKQCKLLTFHFDINNFDIRKM